MTAEAAPSLPAEGAVPDCVPAAPLTRFPAIGRVS